MPCAVPVPCAVPCSSARAHTHLAGSAHRWCSARWRAARAGGARGGRGGTLWVGGGAREREKTKAAVPAARSHGRNGGHSVECMRLLFGLFYTYRITHPQKSKSNCGLLCESQENDGNRSHAFRKCPPSFPTAMGGRKVRLPRGFSCRRRTMCPHACARACPCCATPRHTAPRHAMPIRTQHTAHNTQHTHLGTAHSHTLACAQLHAPCQPATVLHHTRCKRAADALAGVLPRAPLTLRQPSISTRLYCVWQMHEAGAAHRASCASAGCATSSRASRSLRIFLR